VAYDISVEFAFGADPDGDPTGWSWDDETPFLRQANGAGISIHVGSSGESSQSTPASIQLTLDNRDGRFTPDNPAGAHYPNVRLNTPVRVLIDGVGSSPPYELVRGFVDEWPPSWSTGAQDAWVSITASGRFRRWANADNAEVLDSMLHRILEADGPVAYWPMEDDSDATSFASALGHAPMTFLGDVTPSIETAIVGSRPLPALGPGASTSAVVPPYTSTGQWMVEQTLYIPTEPAGVITLLEIVTTGTVVLWRVTLTPGASTATLDMEGYNSAGTDVVAYGGGAIDDADLYGLPLLLTVTNDQNGTSVDWAVGISGDGGGGGFGATTASVTVGVVKNIRNVANANYDGISVGHTVVYDDTDAISLAFHNTYLDGDPGEPAALRLGRLLTEEGVPYDVAGLGLSDTTMGPQPSELSLLDLLRQSEAADGGILHDCSPEAGAPLGGPGGIFYVGLDALYNRDPDITLDLEASQLAPPFAPTYDDRLIVNDATVFRDNQGSWARVVDETGPKGVQAEGRYRRRYTLNVETDAQLPHQAGWRVNLGTARGMRYPRVRINFRRSPELIQSWLDSIQVGIKIRLTNPPDEHAPDDVDLIVIGFDMFIDPYNWIVDCVCVPASPYTVFEVADTTADANPYAGRLAGDEDAALRVAVDDNDTSFPFDPNTFRWTTVADDFDPDLKVRLGGEVVEVSAISTTAATYVGRGALASADNAAVTPATTGFGAADGDLLCCLGRIRGTTGSLTATAGWDLMGQIGNLYLWGQIRSGTTPITVTPTGGAAGDVVSATVFALHNMPTTVDPSELVLDVASQSNGSAQDIAYPGVLPVIPGVVVLLLAGKSDDWTSVLPSGLTESGEPSTTTGNDQGLYIGYQIQTTAALVNGGTLVVTGGAAAVSEAMTLVLAAGFQTMTVATRSVNGVVKSHAAGTRIEVENAYVLAL